MSAATTQTDAEHLIEDRSTTLGYGAFVDSYFEEALWHALSDAEKDSEYELAIPAELDRDSN